MPYQSVKIHGGVLRTRVALPVYLLHLRVAELYAGGCIRGGRLTMVEVTDRGYGPIRDERYSARHVA